MKSKKGLQYATNLCKVLPNLLRLFTFSFPLLTNNFRNIGIVEPRIASDDRLLMVLPIENKCYKVVSGEVTPTANKDCFLCSFHVTPPVVEIEFWR